MASAVLRQQLLRKQVARSVFSRIQGGRPDIRDIIVSECSFLSLARTATTSTAYVPGGRTSPRYSCFASTFDA